MELECDPAGWRTGDGDAKVAEHRCFPGTSSSTFARRRVANDDDDVRSVEAPDDVDDDDESDVTSASPG